MINDAIQRLREIEAIPFYPGDDPRDRDAIRDPALIAAVLEVMGELRDFSSSSDPYTGLDIAYVLRRVKEAI